MEPVTRLLHHAEALQGLSEALPESLSWLALILFLLAQDLKKCGEKLDGKLSPSEF